jgi:hypothetical protein
MKNNFVRSLVAAAGAIALLSLAALPACGQSAPAKAPNAAAKTEAA